jgi:hypothetical protein
MPRRGTKVHFNCRNCNALYHVVKVEAGPRPLIDRLPAVLAVRPYPLGRESTCAKISFCENRHAPIQGRVSAHSDNAVRAQPSLTHDGVNFAKLLLGPIIGAHAEQGACKKAVPRR